MNVSRWIATIAFSISGLAMVAAQTVRFDDRTLDYPRNRPYTRGGTVYVPFEQTAKKIGAGCERDGDRYTLIFSINRMQYRRGERTFRLNGISQALESGSEERDGQTYVPAQLFSDLTRGRFSVGRGGGHGDRPGDRPGPSWGGRRLTYNGRELSFSGNERPYESQGTLLVPFRAMGDRIGARTDRTADGKRVWIYMHGDRVEYDKGRWYRLNSTRKNIGASAEERDGVLFVPLVLFTDISRGDVSWRR